MGLRQTKLFVIQDRKNILSDFLAGKTVKQNVLGLYVKLLQYLCDDNIPVPFYVFFCVYYVGNYCCQQFLLFVM